MIREVIVVLVSFCCLGAPLQLVDFGATAGDSLIDAEDGNNTAELKLRSPVVFYGANFTSVFVS